MPVILAMASASSGVSSSDSAVDEHQRFQAGVERRRFLREHAQEFRRVVDGVAQVAGPAAAVGLEQRIFLGADHDDVELALLRALVGLLGDCDDAALGQIAVLVDAGDGDLVLAVLDRDLDHRLLAVAADRARRELADIAAVGEDGEIGDVGAGFLRRR